MLKKMSVQQAVGTRLAHDITEIRPGEFKGTSFKKGDLVAATRAIPLVMQCAPIEKAASIASHDNGTIIVKPVKSCKTGLIITGNEVFSGLIEDKFEPVL